MNNPTLFDHYVWVAAGGVLVAVVIAMVAATMSFVFE